MDVLAAQIHGAGVAPRTGVRRTYVNLKSRSRLSVAYLMSYGSHLTPLLRSAVCNCSGVQKISNYITAPWSRSCLEELIVVQVVKKFPFFHGIVIFSTVLTRSRRRSLSWSQLNPVDTLTLFSFGFPSTRRYSKWSVSFGSSDFQV
jgi:hypothetical protein